MSHDSLKPLGDCGKPAKSRVVDLSLIAVNLALWSWVTILVYIDTNPSLKGHDPTRDSLSGLMPFILVCLTTLIVTLNTLGYCIWQKRWPLMLAVSCVCASGIVVIALI